MADLNGVNLCRNGIEIAHDLKDVECDQRLKNVIFELANTNHFLGKKVNDCIEVICIMSQALEALNLMADHFENNMYKKQNQHEM